MSFLKKDFEQMTQRHKGRLSLLSVILILATMAIIVAMFFVVFGTAQKDNSSALSDISTTIVPDESQISDESKIMDESNSSEVSDKPDESNKTEGSDVTDESKRYDESKISDESNKIEESKITEESDKSEESKEESKKPDDLQPTAESAARKLLGSMTLEEKIYQLFIVTPEQVCDSRSPIINASSVTQSALGEHPVGGVIFFSENIKTPEQTARLIYALQSNSKLGLFIAVDEEGGIVARLGRTSNMNTTAFPPMGEIGATGDTNKAYNVGFTIGNDIRRFGFNLDFAPVADVFSNPNNKVIANRSFSSDPQIAADMVAACVSGFKKSGTLCTLKHFPGHGDTETDSHFGAATSYKTLEELQKCEFLPFKAGIEAGADFVMLGHISLPNVTGNNIPATLSYEITTGILRNQLGFDGVVVTDSMSMGAITDRYTSAESAVLALQAGADMILMPPSLNNAVNGVLNAVKNGELSEERINESVYRILYSKLTHDIIPLS